MVEIADILEHAGPAMTMRVYLGRGQVMSERAAEALDDLP